MDPVAAFMTRIQRKFHTFSCDYYVIDDNVTTRRGKSTAWQVAATLFPFSRRVCMDLYVYPGRQLLINNSDIFFIALCFLYLIIHACVAHFNFNGQLEREPKRLMYNYVPSCYLNNGIIYAPITHVAPPPPSLYRSLLNPVSLPNVLSELFIYVNNYVR